MTPLARFVAKVCVRPDTGCHDWVGAVGRHGYGNFWDGVRYVRAHRFAYEQQRGGVPDGMELDHVCRNTRCVNPEHLEAVTHRENMRRSSAMVAAQMRQTTCKRGHQLSGSNLYAWHGERHCIRCRRDRKRAYAAASRSAR